MMGNRNWRRLMLPERLQRCCKLRTSIAQKTAKIVF